MGSTHLYITAENTPLIIQLIVGSTVNRCTNILASVFQYSIVIKMVFLCVELLDYSFLAIFAVSQFINTVTNRYN